MPSRPAARIAAISRYGFADASAARISTRVARPRSDGIAQVAQPVVAAEEGAGRHHARRRGKPLVRVHRRGRERRQSLRVGEDACCERRRELAQAAVVSPRTRCRRRRQSETCTWWLDPSCSVNGLAMNVASSPWLAATSLTISSSRNARSAASSASLCERLISNCPGENSRLAVVTPELEPVERLVDPAQHTVGIGAHAGRVRHAGAGRVARDRAVRVLAHEVELRLGGDDGAQPALARARRPGGAGRRGSRAALGPSGERRSASIHAVSGCHGSDARASRGRGTACTSGNPWPPGNSAPMSGSPSRPSTRLASQ